MKKKGAENIFVWKDFKSWKGFVEQLIPKDILRQLKDKFRRKENHYEYCDVPSDFRETYQEYADYDELILNFKNQFWGHFNFVKMFHAGRPENPDSYIEQGLLVLNTIYQRQRFRDYFLGNPKFPLITDEILKSCKDNSEGMDSIEGRVYLCLDERYLQEYSYHYMLFGSEYIQGIAACVEGATGYMLKRELTKIGISSIVAIKVPPDFISENEIEYLGSHALLNWALRMQSNDEISDLDFCLCLSQSIEPNLVLGYKTFESIEDKYGMLK